MIKRKLLITPCLVIAFHACLAAAEIIVTDIKQYAGAGSAAYEITINNAVVIKDVRLESIGGKRLVKLPEYVSQRKQIYPQVVFTTRKANEAVNEALLNNKVQQAHDLRMKHKVVRFTPYRKRSNLKALATVSFNDSMEIECKIIEGKNGPWVSWPSRKNGKDGAWFDQVDITDKRLREAVEEDLLSTYQAMAAEEE